MVKGSNRSRNDRFEFGLKEEIPESRRPLAFRQRWFFDIYIQVVNTTFRTESDMRADCLRNSLNEFQLSWISYRGNRLIKLRRAHDGCLGANRR